MKKAFLLCAFILSLLSVVHAQPAQSRLLGTIYKSDTTPCKSCEVIILKVTVNDVLYSTGPITYKTDATGQLVDNSTPPVLGLPVPQGSVVWVYSAATPGLNLNRATGTPIQIPATSTAQLEQLATLTNVLRLRGSLVYGEINGKPTELAGNTVTTPKVLVSRGTGAASLPPEFWTVEAGANVTVSTDTNNKRFTIAATGGGGGGGSLSVRQVLGSPITTTTLEFANELAVSDQSGGVARVSLGIVPLSSLATVTANRALISDGLGMVSASAVTSTELGYLSGVTSSLQSQLNAKAPLASPTFTGTPAAPTATSGTNTTQLATTAFVQAAIAGSTAGVSSFNGRTGIVSPATNDYTWAQVNKATSSLADITTRSASDLSSGTLPLARLAGITTAELSATAGITNGQLAGSIAYNKLSLSGSIVNADINAAAGIVYSKLSLAGQIVNADISASAAIAASKISGLSTVATTGAYADLSGKPTLGTAAALNVPATGDAASGEVVKGNDSRLSDARTPTTHTHAEADVTNLVTDLAGKAPTTRAINTGAGLSGGGNLTADRTLAVLLNSSGGLVSNLGAGTNELGIGANAVSNSMLSTVATATFKGRITAGTGNVETLTATQATSLLNAFVGDSGSGGTKGLVPAPASGDATKFLKGDGSWATPAGGGGGSGTVNSGLAKALAYYSATGTAVDGAAGIDYATDSVLFRVKGQNTTDGVAGIKDTSASAVSKVALFPALLTLQTTDDSTFWNLAYVNEASPVNYANFIESNGNLLFQGANASNLLLGYFAMRPNGGLMTSNAASDGASVSTGFLEMVAGKADVYALGRALTSSTSDFFDITWGIEGVTSAVPATAMVDANLAAGHLHFYLDETADTLKAKWKESGGTAFNKTILMTDGNGSALTSLNGSSIASGTVGSSFGGAGTVNGLLKANGSGVVSAATPGTDYLAAAITSLGGQTGATQTFGKTDDTNVTLAISSATNNHQFALGWTGTLAKARQHAATVYTDQANTFGAFVNSFQAGSNFLFLDPTDTTKKASIDVSNIGAGLTRTINIPNANSTTVQADTGSSNNFLTAISAQGVISKAQPSFSNLSGTATAGQLPSTAVNSVVNDTNVTGSISAQALTLSWTGTLAKARQHAATVYTDQANTFGNFIQTFQAGANHVLTDTTDTTKKFIFDASNIGAGLTRTINVPNANSTTVQADAGASNNFLTAISAQGVISKAQPSFSNLSGTATAGQLPSTAVNSVVNDTNVTGSISAQALTLSWTGTLAKARQNAATVYNDAGNTYSTGAQDFGSATSLKVPSSASAAPTTGGFVAYDSTGFAMKAGINGVSKTFLMTDGSGASLTSLNASNIASGTLGSSFGGAGTVNGLLKANGSGVVSAATPGTDYLAAAITSLGGQTGATQTFGKTDDTNVTLAISSATNNHQFALGWTGTLAKARQHAATVYTDQANTFGAFVNSFQAGSNFLFLDPTDTTKKASFDVSNIGAGLTRTINIPNANSTTVQADTGSSNNFLTAISAQGVISKAQPSFSNLSGTATAGQLPSTAVNSVVNDTNVTGSISAQALTLSWTGTLAKARQHAATVYTDQANTFGNFVQTLQAGSNFLLVDPTDTTKKASFDVSNIGAGLTRTINVPNANSTTVQADTGSSNNFLTAISAQGVISKAQPSFSNLSGTATAGQLPSTAVNSVVNDTNVTGSISAQALTLAWAGTLAKARQNAATVYNDAGNTYSTGAQDFGSATSLKVPSSASAAPTTGGFVAYDSSGFAMKAGINGVSKTFLMTDGSGASLTSLNGSSISSGTVAAARGGTGFDSSASSGVPYISSGSWSATASAGTSAQWIASSSGTLISKRREHVPQAYGAACNGSTNDQSAIQTMMNALVSGDRVSFAGCLNFALSSSVTIGNGSGTYNSSTSATASTVNDIEIDGAGATVTWTGSSGGPFIVNGPISRLNLHGFSVNMGGNAGIAFDINHARQSIFDNLYTVTNADWALRIRAYQQWTPADGANANTFSNIRVSSTTTGAKGLDIGDGNTCNACSMHLDVAHNNFRNIRVTFNITASTYVTSSIAMRLNFTDASECDGCILSAETALQVNVPSGTAGPSYPAGYLFNGSSLQGSTASFAVNGTWTPVEKIGFTGYLTGDSQTIPTDANTYGITSKGVTWGLSSQAGEIGGLRLEYVASNQVKIYTGFAQVQSLGRTVTLTSDTTVTISSPSNSTWYYCYLFESSGTGAVECNTTAPASTPWFGTASSKTSDSSRRYLGAVKTNGSGNLLRFAHNPITNYYQWLEDTTASPFRVLSGGTDTTEGADAVDCSAVVPAVARSVQLRMINTATSAGNIWLRTAASNSNANLFTVRLNSDFISPMVVDSSRTFYYIYSATPAGGVSPGAYMDVIGFFDLR